MMPTTSPRTPPFSQQPAPSSLSLNSLCPARGSTVFPLPWGRALHQGLTLVHISAQPEHFLRIFVTETSGLISQKMLKSI